MTESIKRDISYTYPLTMGDVVIRLAASGKWSIKMNSDALSKSDLHRLRELLGTLLDEQESLAKEGK
jgi:hypothetical protein